jgi:hypothetical protein
MPKNKTKKIFLLILTVDIILVILFCALFLYVKSQNIKVSNIESEIRNEIRKQESRSIMQEDLNRGIESEIELKKYFVEKENIVGFIEIIEDAVFNSGLKSEVKSVSTESNDKLAKIDIEILRVKLDVIGEWGNILYFVKLLENYPLEIKIEKMFLTKYSDYDLKNKIMPQWLASLDFTVLKLKDNK